MNQKLLLVVSLSMSLSLLSGCAATQVALSKRKLDVQTKMSASVFIDPPESDKQKTVYIQSKNSSDKPDFQISSSLQQALNAKGLKVVSRMSDAHFVLQVNVLQVGKMDPSAAEAAVYKGYGVDGVALGMGTAYVAGGDDKMMVGAGILGGIASVVADSLVKDVHFSVITDLQIKERVRAKVKNHTVHMNQSGTSGGTISSFTDSSNWKTYQTRILSSANKVNLEFAEASPELQKSLSQVIAGIF